MRTIKRRTFVLIGLCGALVLLRGVPACAQSETVKTEVELSTKDIGVKQNPLGDLITDAMRAAAKTDAAVIAAAHFAEVPNLSKGSVSVANILKALKFESDNVVIVKLTGDQIVRALKHGLHRYPDSNTGFLQFSGLTVTINPDAEQEARVVSVKLEGTPLDPGKTYRVAMPEPLATGALGYFKVWKKSDIEKNTKKTLEEAITEYLRDHKTITKGDTRLVIKGK